MRYEFGFQFEFRRSSEFSISNLSSFGEQESSIPVSSSAALGLRPWKASSVELVQLEYFGLSRSGVVIGMDTLDVIRASVRRRMTKWMDWMVLGYL